MFIDTHCHLVVDKFSEILDEVINGAEEKNLTKIITMGTDVESSISTASLIDNYDIVYGAVGIHPEEFLSLECIDSSLQKIIPLFSNNKIVAVGEIGLDIRYINFLQSKGDSDFSKGDSLIRQVQVFSNQLDLSLDLGLPVVVHCRESEKEMFDILNDYSESGGIGVLHSFTGNPDFMEHFINKGWFISFNGIITFKNGENVRDLLRLVPPDQLIFETDAPFLSPEPYRGKLCKPEYVVEVYKKAAEIKNIELNSLKDIVDNNVDKLFFNR